MNYKILILLFKMLGYGSLQGYATSWETEEALHIEDQNINDSQLMNVIQSRPQSHKILSLPGNPITDLGADALIQRFTSLTSLNLARTNLSNDGVIRLARSFSSLKILDLSYIPFKKSGAKAIGEGLPELESLTLLACQLKPSACAEITSRLTNLHVLNMAFNCFDSEGTHSFVSTPHPFLSSLNLRFNMIKDIDVLILGRSLWFGNLRKLNLSHNSIGSYGIEYIVRNLIHLEVLMMSHNQVEDGQAVIIAETLHNLQLLNLESNNIGDRGVLALIKAPFEKLRMINLLLNPFGEEGEKALEKFKKDRQGKTFVYWHSF